MTLIRRHFQNKCRINIGTYQRRMEDVADDTMDIDEDLPATVVVKYLLTQPTYAREAQQLREKKADEIELVPGFEKALEQLRKRRTAERAALESTVRKWGLQLVGRVFERWKNSVAAIKRAASMLGQFLGGRLPVTDGPKPSKFTSIKVKIAKYFYI